MVTFDSTDLDSATSESGTGHESTTNTDHDNASELKQGYDIANPYLSADLIGYWPLQEDSGTTAYDFSGNNNDGTTNGGVTVNATGLLGTSGYSFDGTDDFVEMSGPIVGGLSEFTVNLWINADQTSFSTWKFIIGEYNWGTPINFYIAIDTNNDEVTTDIGGISLGSRISAGVPNTGAWEMYTLVYDGTNNTGAVRIYRDGTQQASTSADGSTVNSNSLNLNIAQTSDNTRQWPGDYCDVRIYNRALSASEIQTLYDVVNSAGTLTTPAKTV